MRRQRGRFASECAMHAEEAAIDSFLQKHHPSLSVTDLKKDSRKLRRYNARKKKGKMVRKDLTMVVLGEYKGDNIRIMCSKPCLHCTLLMVQLKRYRLCNLSRVCYRQGPAGSRCFVSQSLRSLCQDHLDSPIVSRRHKALSPRTLTSWLDLLQKFINET